MTICQGTCNDALGPAKYLHSGKGTDHGERVDWVLGRNVMGTDPKSIDRQFEDARAAHDRARQRRVKQLVGLFVLSWYTKKRNTKKRKKKGGGFFVEEREEPTPQEMQDVAERVLKALGLEDHPALIVAHGDTQVSHLHIELCRVHPATLDVWNGHYSIQKANKLLREIEREKGWETPRYGNFLARHGYAPTLSRTYLETEVGKAKAATTTLRGELREDLAPSLEGARSWTATEKILEKRGLHFSPRKSGFVVTGGGVPVKLSSLSDALSRRKLESKFAQTWEDYAGDSIFQRWDEAHTTPDEPRRGAQVVNELAEVEGGLKGKIAGALAANGSLAEVRDFAGFEATVEGTEVEEEALRFEMGRSGFRIGVSGASLPLRAISNALSKERLERRFGETYKQFVRSEAEAGRGDLKRLPPDVKSQISVAVKKACKEFWEGPANSEGMAEDWLNDLIERFDRRGIAAHAIWRDHGRLEDLALETGGWPATIEEMGMSLEWATFRKAYNRRIARRTRLAGEARAIVNAYDDRRADLQQAKGMVMSARVAERTVGVGSGRFRDALGRAKHCIGELKGEDRLEDLQARLANLEAETNEECGAEAFEQMLLTAGRELLVARVQSMTSSPAGQDDSAERLGRLGQRLDALEARERTYREGPAVEERVLREALESGDSDALPTRVAKSGLSSKMKGQVLSVLEDAREDAENAQQAEVGATRERGGRVGLQATRNAGSAAEALAVAEERRARSEVSAAHALAKMRLRAARAACFAASLQGKMDGPASSPSEEKISPESPRLRVVAARALLRATFREVHGHEGWRTFAQEFEDAAMVKEEMATLIARYQPGDTPASQWLGLTARGWVVARGTLASDRKQQVNRQMLHAEEGVRGSLRAALKEEAYHLYAAGDKIHNSPRHLAERLERTPAEVLRGRSESEARQQAEKALRDTKCHLRLLSRLQENERQLDLAEMSGQETKTEMSEADWQRLAAALNRHARRAETIDSSAEEPDAELLAEAGERAGELPERKVLETRYRKASNAAQRASSLAEELRGPWAERAWVERRRPMIAWAVAEVLLEERVRLSKQPALTVGTDGEAKQHMPPFVENLKALAEAGEEESAQANDLMALWHRRREQSVKLDRVSSEIERFERRRLTASRKLDKLDKEGRSYAALSRRCQQLAERIRDTLKPKKERARANLAKLPTASEIEKRSVDLREKKQDRIRVEERRRKEAERTTRSRSETGKEEEATGAPASPGRKLTPPMRSGSRDDRNEDRQQSSRDGECAERNPNFDLKLLLLAIRNYEQARRRWKAAEDEATRVTDSFVEAQLPGDPMKDSLDDLRLYADLWQGEMESAEVEAHRAARQAQSTLADEDGILHEDVLRKVAEGYVAGEEEQATQAARETPSGSSAGFAGRRRERSSVPPERLEDHLEQTLMEMLAKAEEPPPTAEHVVMVGDADVPVPRVGRGSNRAGRETESPARGREADSGREMRL